METHAAHRHHKEEQVHEYESLSDFTLTQGGVTDQEKPTNTTTLKKDQCQRKTILAFFIISTSFSAAIVILSVLMYSITDKIDNIKEMCLQNHNEKVLNMTQNQTISIHERAAVTSCAIGKDYTSDSVMLFTIIKTQHGFENGEIDTLKSSGKFTCTSPGLYLISFFINSHTKGSRVQLYKNDNTIAFTDISQDTSDDTGTAMLLQDLNSNDTIYVKTVNDMNIHGDIRSCISILQIIVK